MQVEKKHGRVGQKLDARAFRAACRAYAMEQVELQRKDFKRLGVMGDWDRPYLTMAPQYEAKQIRALGKVIANGHIYIGAKPVYWCLDCRSALAEAEVEYEDKTSPAIDVAFAVADVADFVQAHWRGQSMPRCRRCRGHLDHHAVDAARQRGRDAARRIRIRAGRFRPGR